MAHALVAGQFRLGRARHLLTQRTEELRCLREESIRLLATAMDLRDGATGSHSARTAEYAYAIARRLDGTGYPGGLTGHEIPEAGRIAAVADVADALLSDRPYRAAYTFEQALDILLVQRGGQLDPCMVDALIRELRP